VERVPEEGSAVEVPLTGGGNKVVESYGSEVGTDSVPLVVGAGPKILDNIDDGSMVVIVGVAITLPLPPSVKIPVGSTESKEVSEVAIMVPLVWMGSGISLVIDGRLVALESRLEISIVGAVTLIA
jgi:hypothetical protein